MRLDRMGGSHIFQRFGENGVTKAGRDSVGCFTFREGVEPASCTKRGGKCWRCLLPCLCLEPQSSASSVVEQF